MTVGLVYGWVWDIARGEALGRIREREPKIVVAWSMILVCVKLPHQHSHRMHQTKLRFEWSLLKADIGHQLPYTKLGKASRQKE